MEEQENIQFSSRSSFRGLRRFTGGGILFATIRSNRLSPNNKEHKHRRRKSFKPSGRTGRIGGLLFILLSAVALATTKASAQTLTTLYTFSGGSDPYAGLIADASGNLYGTTYGGGAYGGGTVFKVTPSGTETTLYSFTGGSDGATPLAGLIADASGNLYGTTSSGGLNNFDHPSAAFPAGHPTRLCSVLHQQLRSRPIYPVSLPQRCRNALPGIIVCHGATDYRLKPHKTPSPARILRVQFQNKTH